MNIPDQYIYEIKPNQTLSSALIVAKEIGAKVYVNTESKRCVISKNAPQGYESIDHILKV